MMIELVVRSKQVIDKLHTVAQRLPQQRRAALVKAAIIVEGEAKKRAPHDTGRLRSSITHALRDDETAVVGTNIIYAPIQEFGGPKRNVIIEPKRAKVLAFIPKGETKVIFRKRAEIPADAIKAKMYLHGALEAKRADIAVVLARLVKGALNA